MTAIKSLRIAADVPEVERSKLEILRTDTATFKAVVEAQRNRGGDWYKVPVGYIELCYALCAIAGACAKVKNEGQTHVCPFLLPGIIHFSMNPIYTQNKFIA